MATTNQIQEPVIAIASENVEQAAKLAWDQVYAVADSVPEPTIGKASGFLPSDLCYKVMNGAVEEYPDKVWDLWRTSFTRRNVSDQNIRPNTLPRLGGYQEAGKEEWYTFPVNLELPILSQ